MKAILKFPVLGYIDILLIEKRGLKWLAELVDIDLKIEVFEDWINFE
jgi:hypothetical protein